MFDFDFQDVRMFLFKDAQLHWCLLVERPLMLAPQTAHNTFFFAFFGSWGIFYRTCWLVREKDCCPCTRRGLFHLQKQFAVWQDRQRCHPWHCGAFIGQYVWGHVMVEWNIVWKQIKYYSQFILILGLLWWRSAYRLPVVEPSRLRQSCTVQSRCCPCLAGFVVGTRCRIPLVLLQCRQTQCCGNQDHVFFYILPHNKLHL